MVNLPEYIAITKFNKDLTKQSDRFLVQLPEIS